MYSETPGGPAVLTHFLIEKSGVCVGVCARVVVGRVSLCLA